MIELELIPVRNKPGKYVAVLDGEFMTRPTRQPFFAAARTLLERGWSPDAELVARHRGDATVAMRPTVGDAARWTVWESDKGGLRKELWKARSFCAVPLKNSG